MIEWILNHLILSCVLGGIGFIFGLIVFFSSFYTVEQQTAAVIERFRKYVRTAGPGLNMKIPMIESLAARVSLRVHQLDLDVETKTKDDVFVHVKLAVQYYVPSLVKVFDAHYKLVDHSQQMNSWVFDVVRAKVPTMKLDEVFENKDEIADEVKKHLQTIIRDYGFEIVRALVNDIEPDEKVKKAMNEINTQQRLRSAAEFEGEAKKVLVVKAAEADAERKKQQGIGIASERKEIMKGLGEAIEDFKEGVPESTAQQAMDLLVLTQYFDVVKDIGADARAKVVFLPYAPNALGDLREQIQNALIAGGEAVNESGRSDNVISPETKKAKK